MVALLVIAAVALVAIQWRRPKAADPWVGLALPPISAEGWLNSEPIAADDLRGHVVLVDFWSTDCVVCVQQAPELRKLHERYGDSGLKLVGFTPEPGSDRPRLERFVTEEGFGWPIGYGAGFMFEMMGIQFTPTYVLYDRSGRSVWGGHSLDGLDDAIVAALAKQ